MAAVGIICEYNPFHRGHEKQIAQIKHDRPQDAVVCLMSGLFVQRGHPAVFNPAVRARAALQSGADLVLELPVNVSLSSAEGFADGAVEIFSRIGVDSLCFGAETHRTKELERAAEVLLSEVFPDVLGRYLDGGLSFPAARAGAAGELGVAPELLSRPNNILAVEYAKAVRRRGNAMTLMPIHRPGDYHDQEADLENPSATALRRLILSAGDWMPYVPAGAAELFRQAVPHSLHWGERAILGALRTMGEEEFEALPYGSEGLWRKLMEQSRRQRTLEEILTAVKSKRYTRSRLDRMVMCAFLGLDQRLMKCPAPYVRILGCSDRGRSFLRQLDQCGYLVNAGKRMRDDWQTLEDRLLRLYGLFACEPESPVPSARVILR